MICTYGIKAAIKVHLATPAETHWLVFLPHLKNSLIVVCETFKTYKGCCIRIFPNNYPYRYSLQSNTQLLVTNYVSKPWYVFIHNCILHAANDKILWSDSQLYCIFFNTRELQLMIKPILMFSTHPPTLIR